MVAQRAAAPSILSNGMDAAGAAQLISAMATFAHGSAAFDGAPPAEFDRASLQTVIAGAWHS